MSTIPPISRSRSAPDTAWTSPAACIWASQARRSSFEPGTAMPSERRALCATVAMTPPAGLRDQPVELPRVLAGDLLHHVGGQVPELLLDVLGRLGPHAVGVRIVRGPHQRLHAHLVDELGADAVELERGLALPTPVVAGLHGETEVAEAVLPLEVHAIERVGNPADAAFAEGDPQARIPLEHG